MGRKFKNILLIDDNLAENRYNQIILQRMKIIDTIDIVESAEDALKILENADTSVSTLIVLDINMPRMNGWEFLEEYEKLSTEKKEKNIIIILTTSMNPEDREKANQITSVSEFHSKPLTPEILINILERYSSADDDTSFCFSW